MFCLQRKQEEEEQGEASLGRSYKKERHTPIFVGSLGCNILKSRETTKAPSAQVPAVQSEASAGARRYRTGGDEALAMGAMCFFVHFHNDKNATIIVYETQSPVFVGCLRWRLCLHDVDGKLSLSWLEAREAHWLRSHIRSHSPYHEYRLRQCHQEPVQEVRMTGPGCWAFAGLRSSPEGPKLRFGRFDCCLDLHDPSPGSGFPQSIENPQHPA